MEKRSYRFLWLMSLGAVVGAALACWLGPKAIIWYWDPPVSMGVNCKAPIEWSLQRLQFTQLFGIVGGAIGGTVLGFLFGSKNRGTDLPA